MIDSIEALRHLYPEPKERALKKQLTQLDAHARRFIALSPFVVLASANGRGAMDASPRGGPPGFVRVHDDATLLLPDEPGNNRLDTLTNIIATGRAGLLFLIPGVDETLRVNGQAQLDDDPAVRALFASEKRTPRLVIRLAIAEVYLHCAKALMRSQLWQPDARVDRSALPTMGRMISDQTGAPLESQADMLARYAADL
jgi:PPOX class probable FMN-dependent enzyme